MKQGRPGKLCEFEGYDNPPNPISVGKFSIALGKMVKFPWGVYAKYTALHT